LDESEEAECIVIVCALVSQVTAMRWAKLQGAFDKQMTTRRPMKLREMTTSTVQKSESFYWIA